jgi:hypothetical protein
MSTAVIREQLADGHWRLTAGDCRFVYRCPQPGVLCITISGHDLGQFGSSTLDEIAAVLSREQPVELFVDAREAVRAAVSVSNEWTRFFTSNRSRLARVHVLTGSKVMDLTVAIAQHFSGTGDLIQIYSDPVRYETRLASAIGARPRM